MVQVAGHKVQGNKNKLENCCTGGGTSAAAYSSIGFWITNSCDKARLKNSGSQGHGTAGFQIDTGCTNGVIETCYSGGGDGKWTDADNSFVWSDFHYERMLFATSEFDGSTTYNLFKVTGAVKVYNIFGHVTEAIANTSATLKLDLYSTNGTDDITAAGGDVDSDVVGTVYARESVSTDALAEGNPGTAPIIIENANYRDPKNPIILIEDDGADTYIRLVLGAGVADGTIHWHIEWEPITDEGFIEAQ